MAGTVNFVDVDGTTAVRVVDGSTVSGWVDESSLAVNTDVFLLTNTLAEKVSATSRWGYGLGAGLVGEPWDFSSGGGDEGNHIFGILQISGTPDTLPNGGFRLGVAEDQATDSFAVWYIGPQAGSLGGWEYFVIDPAQDFDEIIAAGTRTWTLAGNPAQLDLVDGAGVQWVVSNSITGNTDNCFLQTISIGVGYVITGTDAVFAEFVTYEETNRFGALVPKAGVLFPLCQLRIGTFSGAGNVTFDDDGFAIVWQGQTLSDESTSSVAVGFYGLFVQEGSGTTDVTLANGSFAAEAPSEFDLALAGINSVNIVNIAVDRARLITLDGAVDWDIGQIKNSGQIDASGSIFTNISIQTSTVAADVGAVLWDDTDDPSGQLDDISITKTPATAHHAIEFGDTTPTTITIQRPNFSGFSASNGNNDSTLYFNTTGSQAYTVNVVGKTGDATVSYKVNGAGSATVTIVETVTVTFDTMKDNTEVRVYEAGTFTELDGIENATAGSVDDRNFQANVTAGTDVDYILFSVLYEPIHVLGFTWPSVATTLPTSQRLDRNYSNPA